MSRLSQPLATVISVIDLGKRLIDYGVSKLPKLFSKEKDDLFLKVHYIPLKDLKVDPKYQRLINTTFIKKAKEFDPLLVKPLSVFQRPNDDLMVVDGQHTSCLAATYVEEPEEFKLPCQIQIHPSHFTIEQCEAAEASYFKIFKSLRNIGSAVAKLRSDIAQGAKYAIELQDNFVTLGIHVEGVGAPREFNGKIDVNQVHGYDKLRAAIGKYGLPHVRSAIDLCKKHAARTEKSNKWGYPLNGGLILGLAATYHFIDTYLGKGDKLTAILDYLDTRIQKRAIDKLTQLTSGPQMDVLILSNIIEHYNSKAEDEDSYPTIGHTEKDSIFDQWKKDPIHAKNFKEEVKD